MYMLDNESNANLDMLVPLVKQKVVTQAIGMKIAKSGLQLKHLQVACTRDILDKVRSEKINGTPRVTSTKRIIMSIFDFLCKQMSSSPTKAVN